MTEGGCKFCGAVDEETKAGSDTCDGCWYGMRLEPEEWRVRLAKAGRAPRYRGGCVLESREDGSAAIVCRDPFVPGLEVAPEEEADR